MFKILRFHPLIREIFKEDDNVVAAAGKLKMKTNKRPFQVTLHNICIQLWMNITFVFMKFYDFFSV